MIFFLRKPSLVPTGTNAAIILPKAAFKSSYCKSSVTLVQRAKEVQVYLCEHHLINIFVIISDRISFERTHGKYYRLLVNRLSALTRVGLTDR